MKLPWATRLVVGFEQEVGAHRFWDEMRRRFEEYLLSLHPAKTRLLEFGRFAASNRAGRGLGKLETFNFLGFTLICGRSRFGNFVIRRKTRRDRLRAKLKEIKKELRRRRHQPIPEQGQWLRQVVNGYFAYHAVPTNGPTLGTFLQHIMRLWLRRLRRRSQKDRFEWRRAEKLVDEWLPKPRILHPWPQERFAARYSK